MSFSRDHNFRDGPNLNKLSMRGSPKLGNPATPLENHGTVRDNARTEVVFRNIEERLLKFIGDADIIVGCIAWLTSKPVLEALRTKHAVSLIVQKEDFLRPDIGGSPNWQKERRILYDALPGGLNPDMIAMDEGVMSGVDTDRFPAIEPVRCIGYVNSGKYAAFPRMHNKFIVACKANYSKRYPNDIQWCQPEPYAVWTGSYNFTANAQRSLENAVIIEEKYVAWAFVNEYSQIALLSEPLNWENPWAAPEWFLGLDCEEEEAARWLAAEWAEWDRIFNRPLE